MLVLKIAGILAAVLALLFLLSLLIYYFNLDMKLAKKLMPVMDKIYERGKARRERKKSRGQTA